MPRRQVLEKNVKRMISAELDRLVAIGPCWYRMSVPTGFGRSGLDYEGCWAGRYFTIEAKSPDKDANLTPREREIGLDVLSAQGKVFVISGPDGLEAFKRWAQSCYKI